MAKQLVAVLLRPSRTSTITAPPLLIAHKDGSQGVRQEPVTGAVDDRDLRSGNYLCPAQSHIIVVPLPLMYKSSAMVPSNIHHHFQSLILRGRILHSLSLVDPAAILRTFIHSLLRCCPSPSPLSYSFLP